MSQHDPDDEDWSDADDDDADDLDADDFDDDDFDDDSAPCPSCGAELYADLDHCPQCGHWLSDADRSPSGTGLFADHRVRWISLVLLVIFVLSLLLELFLLG